MNNKLNKIITLILILLICTLLILQGEFPDNRIKILLKSGAILLSLICILVTRKKSKSNTVSQYNYENELAMNSFSVSKEIHINMIRLLFDNKNKRFAIINISEIKIYDYEDLINFEILEDESGNTKNNIVETIFMTILLGIVGFITTRRRTKITKNKCSSITLRLFISNNEKSELTIPILNWEVSKISTSYQKYRTIADTLEEIFYDIKEQKNLQTSPN